MFKFGGNFVPPAGEPPATEPNRPAGRPFLDAPSPVASPRRPVSPCCDAVDSINPHSPTSTEAPFATSSANQRRTRERPRIETTAQERGRGPDDQLGLHTATRRVSTDVPYRDAAPAFEELLRVAIPDAGPVGTGVTRRLGDPANAWRCRPLGGSGRSAGRTTATPVSRGYPTEQGVGPPQICRA
jgi:hypothetical protein